MNRLLNFKDKRKQRLFIIFSVVIFIAIVAGIVCWLCYNAQLKQNEDLYRQLSNVIEYGEEIPTDMQVTNTEEKGQEKTESKVLQEVDFDLLKETNEDIYAWIKIENTQVSYPILQNAEDNYYLKRCINGRSGLPGCIYTNACHAQDFSSWNTVIYGHNMINGTMFGSLKISNDWDDANEYIEIKIPNQTLKYRVYAVTEFSDEYIPLAYDETSDSDKQKFLDNVYLSAKDDGYFREDMVVSIEDKLVTLSTCIKGKNDKRLLVIGVLE